MELREYMENENLSESDIVEAARIVNELCRNLSACKLCPLYNGSRCIAVKTGGVSIVGIVKERMKKLLNPNRMDKVADLLGVKLGDWITVVNMVGATRRYHITANGLYNDKGIAVPGCLTDLLIGVAYIVKEDNEDE